VCEDHARITLLHRIRGIERRPDESGTNPRKWHGPEEQDPRNRPEGGIRGKGTDPRTGRKAEPEGPRERSEETSQ
jgi:hypothetical protein